MLPKTSAHPPVSAKCPILGASAPARKSLAENGLIQPIGIRRGEPKDAEGEGDPPIWVLVHGATRLAAAKLAGWTEIDA